MKKYLYLIILMLQTMTGLAQDVRLIPNPNRIEFPTSNGAVVKGPKGKFYILSKESSRMKILLVRLDTSFSDKNRSNPFQLEKSVDISGLLKTSSSRELINENAIFLCSSEDGNWIAVSFTNESSSSKIHQIFLINFPKEEIRFQKKYPDQNLDIGASIKDGIFCISEYYFEVQKKDKNVLGSDRKLIKKEWYEFDIRTNVLTKIPSEKAGNYLFTSGFDQPEINKEYFLRHISKKYKNHQNEYLVIGDDSIPLSNPEHTFFTGTGNNNIVEINPSDTSWFFGRRTLGKFGTELCFLSSGNMLKNDTLSCIFQVYGDIYLAGLNASKIINVKTGKVYYDNSSYFWIKKKDEKTGFFSVLKRDVSFLIKKHRREIFVDFFKREFSNEIKTNYTEVFPNRKSNNFQIISKLRKLNDDISSNKGKNQVSFLSKTFLNGKEISETWIRARDTTSVSRLEERNANSISDKCEISKDQTRFYLYKKYLEMRNLNGRRAWMNYDYNNFKIEYKLSEDQKTMAVLHPDFSVDLLNADKGSKYLSLVLDTSSLDWVLYTPSGYYDCSPGGENLIGWSVSRGADSLPAYYPASRFRERFYRPDVIDSALKYCSEEIALKKLDLKGGNKVKKRMVKNLPPIIQITSPAMNEFFSDTLVKLEYSLQNGSSAVHTLKVLLDGRPLMQTRPDRSGRIPLSLPQRDCSVGLVAISASGESELSFSRLIWKGKTNQAEPSRKPGLYILAVGISRYKMESLRLNFAAKDARDFTAVLKTQESSGLYNKVEVRMLLDSLATRENIEDGLEWLQRQTTSRDVAMIFLAGHGENDENNRFYFLPWGADFDHKISTCIPYTTFKSTIESLPGKVVVFADACRSGNIFGALARREVDVEMLSRELSSSGGGAVVFTSSSRKQSSLESQDWNNGAFTRALVEGLEGKADPYNQKYISVQSLNAWISHRVNELTKGLQKPNIIIPESMPDFAISLRKN